MSSLSELQKLGLISKICSELDNHLGFSDKTLAEYIVFLAGQHESGPSFHKALQENGADFPLSFAENLLRIIKTISFNSQSSSENQNYQTSTGKLTPAAFVPRNENDIKFPGLAVANSAPVPLVGMESEMDPRDIRNQKNNLSDTSRRNEGNDEDRNNTEGGDRFKNSRASRDHDRRDRDRERDSRDRDRDRDRNWDYDRRDRDRDRGSRDRDRDSRDRDRDSRDHDRRDRDRDRDFRDRDRDSKVDRYQSSSSRLTSSSTPELYGIYRGSITNILDFGCFVELDGFKKKEGLVHIGQVQSGTVKDLKSVVKRNQKVMVKVISIAGNKLSLSMKEVDQQTGQDLFPERSRENLAKLSDPSGSSMLLNGDVDRQRADRNRADLGLDVSKLLEDDSKGKSSKRTYTAHELFDIQQLINSGVLPISAYPTFDNEVGGSGAMQPIEVEEEIDIDINENEPTFLKGQTKFAKEAEPIKIVQNLDGSLQRAAIHQSQLAKERKELKTAQANSLMESIPKDLSKPWEDPMPELGERHFAHELRSINITGSMEVPEWKAKTQGKSLSYGIISNKNIKEQRESLPIFKLKSQLCQAISQNQVLVVIGETGSGKTTQMTQYLMEMGYTQKGIIGCTQPRRVAAMSVAKRVAEEHGCQLGEEVGYTIRFEDCTSPSTRIKYMTDGMLMREYLADNMLSKYITLMLDEAHERTIHTDVLFGLLKKLLKQRQDLKLIVTSATLDAEKFSHYFNDCPIFTIPGRTFPVEILYCKEPEPDYLEAALITVMQIHLSEPAGDILVFFTGQEEIDTCAEILYSRMKALGDAAPELIILPVYSALPSEVQSRIFEPAPPGARKCVLATNIAEASLTIDGIYYVVDPGFCKQKVYNPKLSMDSLVVCPISAASARQRAGRAGRTGPGKCYRLYTEAAYATEMLPSSIPEIQRTNLGNVVLQLKAMGINDLVGFDFMDPPPVQTLITAMESLYALSALDDEGLLTRLGRKMAEFPLDPPLSKMLILSAELGCSEEILTVVAMLSVEPPFHRPKDKAAQADQKRAKFNQAEGDHISLLVIYDAWKTSKFSNAWCVENFLQARAMKRAQDVRKQLVTILDRYRMNIVSAGRNFNRVRKCIVAGYFNHAAKRDPQEGYRTVAENQLVYIHPSSSLHNKTPEWVIYHEVVMTSKEYMRNVMTIEPKWLVELAPNYFKQADPTKLSKTKKRERIEPLFDRHNPPDAWRLSRRQG